MASLSEVASFAFSGTTAKAVASLITSRVLGSLVVTTSSAKIDSPAPPPAPPASPASHPASAPPSKALFSTSDLIQHLDSFVFFLVLTVASTRIAKLRDEHCSTCRAATEAFVSGAAAGVCMRLVSDVVFHKEKAGDAVAAGAQSKSWPAGAGGRARARAPGDLRQRLASRFSWRNLEEDLVLALDPALTSCLYKIIDELAIKRVAANGSKRKSAVDHAEIAATTFVVAALSKAVAATATYPLQTAEQRRKRQAEADAEGKEGGEDGGHENHENPSRRLPWQARDIGTGRNSNSNGSITSRSRLLSVLGRIAKAEGLLALYTGLLHTVALASLGHGITKAGQGLLEVLVKKLAYVLAGALSALALRLRFSAHRSRQPPETGVPDLQQQLKQQVQQRLQQQLQQRLAEQQRHLSELRPPLPARQLSWPQEDGARAVSSARSPLSAYRLSDASVRTYRSAPAWPRPKPRVLSPAEKRRLLKMYGVIDGDEEDMRRIIVSLLSSSQRRLV